VTTNLTQLDVDYVNEAQKRVCADTLLLEKKANLTFTPGNRTSLLAEDVIRITAAYAGVSRLDMVTTDEMVCETSATNETNVSETPRWAVIGGSFYLTQIPTQTYTVTIIYTARSADYESDVPLEVTGEAENLVERLAAAYKLLDDGQPERSAAELQTYETDVRLYRRLARSRGGTPRRWLTAAWDVRS
jgi:hypothetical protein